MKSQFLSYAFRGLSQLQQFGGAFEFERQKRFGDRILEELQAADFHGLADHLHFLRHLGNRPVAVHVVLRQPIDLKLEANRKTLFRNLNFLREMKGNLRNPVILELKVIKVPDGRLTLMCIPEKDSSVCHFNAAEVIREQ